MRIAFVGHGNGPIPPEGWGAVELLIHETSEAFREFGAEVNIVNVKAPEVPRAVRELAKIQPLDWVWCHNERAIWGLKWLSRTAKFRLVATGHMAFDPAQPLSPMLKKFFRRLERAPYQLALSEAQARQLRSPYIKVVPNGVCTRHFHVSSTGNGRAICLGKIESRKQQRELASLGLPIDFVGPTQDPFEAPTYLGSWSRQEVCQRLTDYSVLILLSKAEAFPLVVLEGMAAGLSVLVSPAAAAAFRGDEPFVRVCSNVEGVPAALNNLLSLGDSQRAAARQFAQQFEMQSVARRAFDQLEVWSKS